MSFQPKLTALSLIVLAAACGGSRDKALTDAQKKELFATLHSAQTLGDGASHVNKKGETPAENNGRGGRGTRKLIAEAVLGSSIGSLADSVGMIPSNLTADEEGQNPEQPDPIPSKPVNPSESEQIGYALNEANCELIDKGDFAAKLKSGNMSFEGDVNASAANGARQLQVGSVLADATISGSTCPIRANFKAVVAALNVNEKSKSGNIKIDFNGGYEATDENFKKLTDLVKMTLQGALSMKMSESEGSMGLEAGSNIVSTARGAITIGVDIEADMNKSKSGTVEATLKIGLKDFTANIVMEAKTQDGKITSQKLTLNGEEITPEELQKRINQGA